MSSSETAACEILELQQPTIPPRSRLYHLEPVGMGTPLSESLTSYIARLAEAHSVAVKKLFLHEIVPRFTKKYAMSGISKMAFEHAYLFDGMGGRAYTCVQVLEELTLRTDLHFLTMLPWSQVLSMRKLIRRTRAWCPACYQEWHEAGQVVYDPLLWTLTAVNICLRHRLPLHTCCPYPDCGKSLDLISWRGRIGYCPYCERWLAAVPDAKLLQGAEMHEDELQQQLWAASAVGELIAAAPNLVSLPARQRLAEAVTTCIEQVTGGNVSMFALGLGLGGTMVRSWKKGKAVAQLESLLTLCSSLGISPLRFLTDQSLFEGQIWQNARNSAIVACRPQKVSKFPSERLRRALEASLASDEVPPPSLYEIINRLGCSYHSLHYRFPALCQAIAQRYRTYRETNRMKLQQILEATLASNEQPPPSMLEVGRRLGYNASNLYARFPDLCRAISRRYQTYQRAKKLDPQLAVATASSDEADLLPSADHLWNALQATLASDEYPPPSMCEVARRLGQSAEVVRGRFPTLCRAISERHRTYRETNRAELQRTLEAVLMSAEDPPPSMEEIARRLGYSPPSLRTSFPDLCDAISRRYKAYRHSRTLELRHALEAVLANPEDPPPPLNEVARRLECCLRQLYDYFPELCHAISEQRKTYWENKKAEWRQALEAVVESDEEPPPSMPEVAQRLGQSCPFFRWHFPELARAISARYLAGRNARANQRQQQLFDEVRQATRELHGQGLYPSSSRVAARLSIPSYMVQPKVYAVWHETLRELGWAHSAGKHAKGETGETE